MNTPCALCDKICATEDKIVHIKCELADAACYRTHAWCKDCWMTELFDFCPVEKKKKKSGITHCCSLCGKIYADRDKMGAILCCEGDDACDMYHVWCKNCWMKNFNLSFCPLARKKIRHIPVC